MNLEKENQFLRDLVCDMARLICDLLSAMPQDVQQQESVIRLVETMNGVLQNLDKKDGS